MANITKRVQKKLASYLDEGELVEAAVLVEPKGTYGIGMLRLAAAPGTSGRHLEKKASEDNAEMGGLATKFPAGSCVIAKTDQRYLISESNGLSFSEPAFKQLRVAQVESKLIGKRLTIELSDGSAITVDAQRGQPIDLLGS